MEVTEFTLTYKKHNKIILFAQNRALGTKMALPRAWPIFSNLVKFIFLCPLQFSPQRSGHSLGFICNCEVQKVTKCLSYIKNSLTSLAMRSKYDFMIQLQIILRKKKFLAKNFNGGQDLDFVRKKNKQEKSL